MTWVLGLYLGYALGCYIGLARDRELRYLERGTRLVASLLWPVALVATMSGWVNDLTDVAADKVFALDDWLKSKREAA